MSSRASSRRTEHKSDSAVNGQIVMNLGHNTTTEKSKVDFIYGAVPSRSKHDILLVLQSCDYNVETAISLFSQGQAEEVLKQWSYKGKRSKDGNKKKRNKKRQNAKEVKEESLPTEQSSAPKSSTDSNYILEKTSQTVPALSLDLKCELPLTSLLENSSLSQDNSTSSSPEILTKKPPSRASSHLSSQPKNTGKQQTPKSEKLSPTSHADALKKSTKDLLRSSFSLARYQVVLEQECEQSFKRIEKTFENIRKCINEREEFLTKALKEFKEEGDKLLQQRLEDAAALRLKTERVQSMPDEQVALLRADIKSFVAERKIDEELAQTKRFVCDEEKLIEELMTFGQVVPIKGTYTPVVLNHHIPKPMNSATTKQVSNSVLSSSTTKQTLINAPTAKSNGTSDVKSSSNNPLSSLNTQPKQPPVSNKLTSQVVDNEVQSSGDTIAENQEVKKSPELNAKHAKDTSNIAASQDSSFSQNQVVTETLSKNQSTTLSSTAPSKQPSARSTTSHKQNKGEVASSLQKNTNSESQAKTAAHTGPTGPPPNISKLISLAMAKSSAVVSGEDPGNVPKHQEAIHTSSSEHKRGARNQPKDQTRRQNNRPNSSQSSQGKQHRSNEPRPRLSQSNRQQGEHKEKESRPNKANTKDQQKPKEDGQSEPQEGRRKRQRRKVRDRKPKENDEASRIKDNTGKDSIQKKSDISGQKDSIREPSDDTNTKIDSSSTEPYIAEVSEPGEKDSTIKNSEVSGQQEATQHNASNTKIDSCSIKPDIVDGIPCPEDKISKESNSKKCEVSGQQGDNPERNEETDTTRPDIANGVPTITYNIEKNANLEKSTVSHKQQDTKEIADSTSAVDSGLPKLEIASHKEKENPSGNTDINSDLLEISSSKQVVSTEVEGVIDKERNGNHKNGTEVESNNYDETQEMKPIKRNTNIVEESNEIPSTALPQRSQRSQGRRRNRIADENKGSSSEHGKNGSSNGLNHESDNCDNEVNIESNKSEKSVVESNKTKEEIVGKLSQVGAPSLINGLDKCLECEPAQMEINKENQLEIDGQKDILVSNGTGDECLIER